MRFNAPIIEMLLLQQESIEPLRRSHVILFTRLLHPSALLSPMRLLHLGRQVCPTLTTILVTRTSSLHATGTGDESPGPFFRPTNVA